MSANSILDITIRTKPGLTNGTYSTTLKLVINGNTYNVPVTLVVDNVSSADEDNDITSRALQVSPNPISGSAILTLGNPLGLNGRITITDARGRTIQTFDAATYAGLTRIPWNSIEPNGNKLAPGVYFITLNDNGSKTTRRVIVIR